MEATAKPKLVFFQWKSEKTPNFLRLHLQQHVKCLSHAFEVVVISENCDYQQICDRYKPDLVLFESGVNTRSRHRLNIKNTGAYPEIPKLGLHNGDSWCEARAGFLSDMENWGIETFFSISTTTAEHTPEIAEDLFVWPNFVDTDVYRDYGYQKIIPVLFTGSQMPLYPWRQRIYKIVSQQYPSLVCPHHGYSKHATARMLCGEQYARTINASLFVPTCGTVAKEIVRKHFEIPASKSCLITEKTPVLEAAGFIDMKNCVFADENDVLDKLDYLFQNSDKLEEITNAGYQLVHSQHTLGQRDQILQWFNLYKTLKPNQRIIQTNPFEQLIVVEKTSKIKNSHIVCNGLNVVLLRQGDEKLWMGQYDAAEALYLKCHNYISWMPEPKLRLALCSLYKGNAENALYWITQSIKYTLEEYAAFQPDPVEWAYFIISFLCQGKLDEAVKRANQFPFLNHPELEHTRLAINILLGGKYQYSSCSEAQSQYHRSVHQLPDRDFNDWSGNLCIMLKACRQAGWADVLLSTVAVKSQHLKNKQQPCEVPQEGWTKKNEFFNSNVLFRKIQYVFQTVCLSKSRYAWRFNHFLSRVLFKLKFELFKALHDLEKQFGYFLPYRFSEMQNDEFFHAIQKIMSEESIKTAILIGASANEGSTEAFITGAQRNPDQPTAFCINFSTSEFTKLQARFVDSSFIKCYEVLPISQKNSSSLDSAISKIQENNQIDRFDVVLIDSSQLNTDTELHLAGEANFVLLDDINTFENYSNYRKLLLNPGYVLAADNPSLRNGYAIFKKVAERN